MITDGNRKHVLVGAELLGLTAEAARCSRMPPGRMRWTRRNLAARTSPGEIALQMLTTSDSAGSPARSLRGLGSGARPHATTRRKELSNVVPH